MNKTLKNGIKCAVVVTAGLYVANKVIHSLATVKQLLTNDNGAFYESPHGNMYYKKQGSGPAMLLIHDLSPEANSYEWSRVVEELSENYTVYTVDLLGCGRSDRPNITYTNFLYVRLIEQFIQDVIEEDTIIATTGRSSSIALLAANSSSEYIKELVLINPQSFPSQNCIPNKFSNFVKGFIAFPIFGTAYYNFTQSYASIMKKVTEDYFYENSTQCESLIHHYYESSHLKFSSGKYLYASIATGFTNSNVTHAVKALDIPLHIIIGEDAPNSGVVLESYKKLNPAIDSCILSYTKHLPQFENPEKTLDSMYRLLKIEDSEE